MKLHRARGSRYTAQLLRPSAALRTQPWAALSTALVSVPGYVYLHFVPRTGLLGRKSLGGDVEERRRRR